MRTSETPKPVPGLMPKKNGNYGITLECPGGLLSVAVIEEVARVARTYGAKVRITTAQKIMLLDLDRESGIAAIESLESVGALVRKARDISQAMVCVGKPYCPLSLGDTLSLSEYLYKEVARIKIPPKIKTAISGCPACCSWANLVDIGFVCAKGGYKVLVGGHGGNSPRIGTEIGRIHSNEEAAEVVKKASQLFIEFTSKKGRFDKVIEKIGMDEVKTKLGF